MCTALRRKAPGTFHYNWNCVLYGFMPYLIYWLSERCKSLVHFILHFALQSLGEKRKRTWSSCTRDFNIAHARSLRSISANFQIFTRYASKFVLLRDRVSTALTARTKDHSVISALYNKLAGNNVNWDILVNVRYFRRDSFKTDCLPSARINRMQEVQISGGQATLFYSTLFYFPVSEALITLLVHAFSENASGSMASLVASSPETEASFWHTSTTTTTTSTSFSSAFLICKCPKHCRIIWNSHAWDS